VKSRLSGVPYCWIKVFGPKSKWVDENLRLFSERNALGVQASVYNVKAKNWIAPSELVEDIEQGKDRAAPHPRTYLRHAGNLELPPLEWKKSRSA
jgi:hypothetical protein